MLHGSQALGGNGLGRPNLKHEQGVGYFVVPKSGVVWVLHGSHVWGGQGLGGASWFP